MRALVVAGMALLLATLPSFARKPAQRPSDMHVTAALAQAVPASGLDWPTCGAADKVPAKLKCSLKIFDFDSPPDSQSPEE